jgi:HAD superfamily hydrolase (TIGR01458 family)
MLKIHGNEIKVILSDIDGTLLFKGKEIPGSINAISKLRENGVQFLFLTNTDSKHPNTILNNLKDLGFYIKQEEILTPIIVLEKVLSQKKNPKVYLVVSKEIESFLQSYIGESEQNDPEFVVIGDFRDNWDVHRLNSAFRFLMRGANLIGTQGNRYFLDLKGEPTLDSGSFIELLQFASSKNPMILGKPSATFFKTALCMTGCNQKESIVIGDDLESDILGGNKAGLRTILVKTGKGTSYKSGDQKLIPDLIINSFKDILTYMK